MQDKKHWPKHFLESDDFTKITTIKPGTWMHHFPEDKEESVKKYMKSNAKGCKGKIYLLPLDMPAFFPMKRLVEYTKIYFHGLQVECLDGTAIDMKSIKSRTHYNQKQYLTKSIANICKQMKPKDAYCVVAITMTDLYPGDAWNFVFGEAFPQYDVGVFSFARYFEEQDVKLLFQRACSVCVHEIGHLFNLSHCTTWYCLMNGSNSLEESDTQPMHLCPHCLMKLQHKLQFDVMQRYQELLKFYTHPYGEWARVDGETLFEGEQAWMEKRIQSLQ